MQNSCFHRHLRSIALSDLAHSYAISGSVGFLAGTFFTRTERPQSVQMLGFGRFELEFGLSPTFSCPLGWQLMEPSFGAGGRRRVSRHLTRCAVRSPEIVSGHKAKAGDCQLICIVGVALVRPESPRT